MYGRHDVALALVSPSPPSCWPRRRRRDGSGRRTGPTGPNIRSPAAAECRGPGRGGLLDPPNERLVSNSLREANRDRRRLLVIQLNSPGLSTSTSTAWSPNSGQPRAGRVWVGPRVPGPRERRCWAPPGRRGGDGRPGRRSAPRTRRLDDPDAMSRDEAPQAPRPACPLGERRPAGASPTSAWLGGGRAARLRRPS